MKKTLMTMLTLLLVAVLALTLFACGKEEEKGNTEIKGPKTDVSIYNAEPGEYPELQNQVSWEDINAQAIKTADMDIAAARQVCVNFFRYAKTATWIPSEYYGIWSDAQLHTDGSEPARSIDGGVVYGGLPYISWATGSIYRLMDYIDNNTGVVDMQKGGRVPLAFGNQCANGAYVGFARVINSATYGVTATMVEQDGFLRVGEYKYSDLISRWGEGYGTPHVIDENGKDVMLESYALLKAGDGMVYWTTAGHVIMIATDPVVVRDEATGKIDPTASYLTIIDQATQFVPYQHEGGDKCLVSTNVDKKMTFQNLLNGKYLPFTFAEWTGEDPIEQTTAGLTGSGGTVYAEGKINETDRKFENSVTGPDSITLDEIFKLKATSNYYILDLYAEIRNANGVEVYKIASRPIKDAGLHEHKFYNAGDSLETWGSEDNIYADQDYTVKIYMQLGTGERPVLWEGKLAQ